MIEYMYTIRWGDQEVSTTSASRARAKLRCLMLARSDGYTLPRWWAFWDVRTDVRD